jgi:hypothetical protein
LHHASNGDILTHHALLLPLLLPLLFPSISTLLDVLQEGRLLSEATGKINMVRSCEVLLLVVHTVLTGLPASGDTCLH